MSDIDDCASQKIDASPSSNSTRNSKRYSFVQAILNTDNSQMLCSYGPSIYLPGERVVRLPRLEKKDFIQNWIIAHSNIANSPQKSCPTSPILGICAAKRSPDSPILGCQWKRIKREAIDKENCRVSLNEKFRETQTDASATVRIDIKKKEPEYTGVVDFHDNNSEKTLTSEDSPVFNQITRSPTLNTRVSGRLSWLERTNSPELIDANTTLNWNNRRSLMREVTKVQESLSLSSPLGARIESSKIENTSNDSIQKNKSYSKQLSKFSEILVEETPIEDDIISSYSKIPETLSLSTIADENEDIEIESKDIYYSNENANIEDREKLQRSLQLYSPIKIKTANQFRETSQHSKRLSMPPSPVNRNTIINDKSKKSPWIIAKKSSVKPESIETLKGLHYSSEIQKYTELPDTLSILSQSGESFHQENRQSTLAKNMPTSVRSVNSTWIEQLKSVVKFKTVASSDCTERLSKNRESSKLPHTISSSTLLAESECIDMESNSTTAHEDDRKIESESDATISDIIENVETQNIAVIGLKNLAAKSARLQVQPEEITRQEPCDSDETYYSDGDSIPRLRTAKALHLKNSQKISQTTSQFHEGRVSVNISEIIISPAPSPVKNSNSEAPANAGLISTTKNNYRKKKKCKKGSLVSKLQTIVSSQVSNLRIWRYQMSRSDFKTSCSQFVVVKVRDRETRYGRHYLTASVITDPHYLLKNLTESTSDLASKKNASVSEVNTLTIVIIPEVVGVVKIKAESSLNIYPPWEIMDKSKKILNVMFFNVISIEKFNATNNKTLIIRDNERIIEEFECPCIRAKALDDCCPVKFSNTKPSVMQAIFGS